MQRGLSSHSGAQFKANHDLRFVLMTLLILAAIVAVTLRLLDAGVF
jgi:hypothetical protein